MALLPWKRGVSRELDTFRDRVNRLFDEFFERGWDLIPWTREGEWVPALDVSESEDAVVVKAELPGMAANEIDVSVSENVLTIKGQKQKETEEEKKNYHRIERTYGAFSRSITLPSMVDTARVEASYDKGVLEIILPKREEAKTKVIKIEVK